MGNSNLIVTVIKISDDNLSIQYVRRMWCYFDDNVKKTRAIKTTTFLSKYLS